MAYQHILVGEDYPYVISASIPTDATTLQQVLIDAGLPLDIAERIVSVRIIPQEGTFNYGSTAELADAISVGSEWYRRMTWHGMSKVYVASAGATSLDVMCELGIGPAQGG